MDVLAAPKDEILSDLGPLLMCTLTQVSTGAFVRGSSVEGNTKVAPFGASNKDPKRPDPPSIALNINQ